MIQYLCELAEELRKKDNSRTLIHDAIKKELISIDLIINKDGSFKKFIVVEKIPTLAEAISAKKGKARLLLDKAEEVIQYGNKKSIKKHTLFLKKLELYKHLKELTPILKFYNENKKNGINQARKSFEKLIPEKERIGNIAFRINNEGMRIHEKKAVLNEIVRNYELEQKRLLSINTKKCSICGNKNYPVEDIPHGMIKRVPDGQQSGCALVSYNNDAFESYRLKGNYNSSICTHCATAYVEAMNWLLSSGSLFTDEKGKKRFIYTNRKNFGKDTAMAFWTKNLNNVKEIDWLEEPKSGDIITLINTIKRGNKTTSKTLNTDYFYAFTLSGAAARIAIRDWIEISVDNLRKNIAAWFQDIGILSNNRLHYSPLYFLASACKNKNESNDFSVSRIASMLWNCAMKNSIPPLLVISMILNRIRKEQGIVTPERAALIKLAINRNFKTGGIKIMEKLDEKSSNNAYIAGRIFAVLESIQWHALGETNAGIRERHFSSASTTPSTAFGRLFKMSQHHLTKLKGEKPGLAVNLDKQIQKLMAKTDSFPTIFSLEEQGIFVIGYYHQKEALFHKEKNN